MPNYWGLMSGEELQFRAVKCSQHEVRSNFPGTAGPGAGDST